MIAHVTIPVTVPATHKGMSRVFDVIRLNMHLYHVSTDQKLREHNFLSEFSRSANELVQVALGRGLKQKQVTTIFRRWFHTTWRFRFVYRIFPVNMPYASVVWNYCERQFVSAFGSQLGIGRSGGLLIREYASNPRALDASPQRENVPHTQASLPPPPAPSQSNASASQSNGSASNGSASGAANGVGGAIVPEGKMLVDKAAYDTWRKAKTLKNRKRTVARNKKRKLDAIERSAAAPSGADGE